MTGLARLPIVKSLYYLNGRFVPSNEARIDPCDRGFLFGDSLYEVVKVLAGTPLHLEPHLERLRRGLERAEIPFPVGMASACLQLVAAADLSAGYLYLQVTRGVTTRQHLPPAGIEPTVLIMPFEHEFDPPASRPLRAITVPDWRWRFRDVKTTSLMATVFGKLRARQGSVDEVIFVGPDGKLREGGSTNVFTCRAGVWETHPTDGTILEGVTRSRVLILAKEIGVDVAQRAPRLQELDQWQEAFLCGTTTGVQPLIELDGRRVAGGGVGQETTRLAVAFDRFERQALGA